MLKRLGLILILVAAPATAQPIPQLALWEAHMTAVGQARCDYLASGASQDLKLQNVYYDAIRVFYQIADYTGNPAWNTCAQRARTVYRDNYVMNGACWPSGWGCIPGYWNFTTGERMDFERTGDVTSKNAVNNQANGASYASEGDWNAPETANAWLSRETAYALTAHLNQERLGYPIRTSTASLLTKVLSHMDQWFGSKTFRCPASLPNGGFCDPAAATGQYYIQPFMVGLSAQALIAWHEQKGADPRILPSIKQAMDWLWTNAWVAADQSFWYENWVPTPTTPFPPQAGSPDLNLLIAPAFAWLYSQTGDMIYRDRGDQIFAGGVINAYLGGGKQFDQNYIYSFDYVRWRAAATPLPTATGIVTIPAVVGAGMPTSLLFAAQAVGTTSAPLKVVITNPGVTDLHYEPTITGPFTITDNGCAPVSGWDGYVNPTSQNPANNCVVSITFTPSGAGPATGLLNIVATPRILPPQPPGSLTISGNCPFTYTPGATPALVIGTCK